MPDGRFRGGMNIAMKLPPHRFDETVRFYTETVGLPVLERTDTSVVVQHGPNRLWLDRVPTVSHAELWLELHTDDPDAAARLLAERGVQRRDEIEPLPDGFRGFWIATPADTISLVSHPDQ